MKNVIVKYDKLKLFLEELRWNGKGVMRITTVLSEKMSHSIPIQDNSNINASNSQWFLSSTNSTIVFTPFSFFLP